MNGFNRIFLMGYLGQDPERQSARDGRPFVRLNVATHFNKRLDKGEKKEATTWHRVTVWGKNAERCQDYLHKGDALAVEGYLSRYTYSREDGTDGQAMAIIAREVHFIARPRSKKEQAATRKAGSIQQSEIPAITDDH